MGATPMSAEDSSWLTPIPHPLDYDWRFTPEAAGARCRLGRRCRRPRGPGPAPRHTECSESAAARRPGCPLTLWDWNAALTDNELERTLRGDLAAAPLPPAAPFPVVVADPPWYPGHFRSFLWTAASLAVPGGRVFLGVPGTGTRPGIEAEWAALVRWARSTGLELEALHEGATDYLTSPFEANALRAAGVTNVPARWRCGSLAEFRRTNAVSTHRPEPPDDRSRWVEHTTGRVRWRVRLNDSSAAHTCKLHPIVSGDVLPSVSRRHPARDIADVWTSGNRIFRCENPNMLMRILAALQSGEHGITRCAQLVGDRFVGTVATDVCIEVERTAEQVVRIIETETSEYGGRGHQHCRGSIQYS